MNYLTSETKLYDLRSLTHLMLACFYFCQDLHCKQVFRQH